MPTHKSARELLNGLLIRSCVHCDEPVEAEKGLKEHNEMVNDCLAQLAELVETKIKNLPIDNDAKSAILELLREERIFDV